MAQPDNFGLYQPLVARALWMGARGLRGTPAAFAGGGPAGRAGDAGPQRRGAGPRGARPRLRRGTAGGRGGRPAHGPRRSRSPRPSPASRCSSWSSRPGGRASWRSSARSRRRPRRARSCSSATSTSGTASRRRPRSSTCWAWAWPAHRGPGRRPGRGADDLLGARRPACVLVPFMVVGGWARRRSLDFGPFFVYAGLLFAFSALVSAVHVPGGTFIHSAVALAPHAYILALEGIAVAVAWVAARRPAWDAEGAARFFGVAAVGFAVVCAIAGALVVHAGWAGGRDGSARSRPRWTRRARPAPTGSCRSTPRAPATGPGAAASSSSTTRSTRSRRSPARTTSAGWSSTGRHGRGRRPDPRRRRATRLDRPAGRQAGAGAGPRRPPADQRSGRLPGLPRRRRRRAARRRAPPRDAVARAPLGAGSSSSSRSWRALFASQIVFPKPEDTAYYVGVARNLRRRPRARLGRDLELPDAAPRRSRGRRSRSGCRCRPSSPRSRWPSPGRRSRPHRSRRSSSGPSSRSSPGGSPPTSPRSGACRPAGPGRWPSAPA